MVRTTDISQIDLAILAGGLGTRLHSVLKNAPKCLAPVNGQPFIDILIDDYVAQGFRRFVVCVGHLREQVMGHLRGRNDCEIVFSEEAQPLGTGGAIGNTESLIKSDLFFVTNGDSFVELKFKDMLNNHLGTASDASIAVMPSADNNRYGNVILGNGGKVLGFSEKSGDIKTKWINAGVYLFGKNIYSFLKSYQSPFSIEKDIFPVLIDRNKVFGYKAGRKFIDIGVPASYAVAASVLSRKSTKI